ncbi:MAG: hypothetical protein KDC13_06600 [Bacteroidetes bacterium]|nr:hypothetical protein [Bacteroidota bacterium]
MHKIFTTEDSVRFVYDEMTPFESAEFEREMADCETLREEVSNLTEMKNALNESAASASGEVINSLLRYSASLRVVHSSSTGGSFGVVLN